ncbi:MAG: galactokinase, partial [Bullifex sp.]
ANTTTKVLRGSGLSSSAAIEVLIAEIFNSLFNDDVLAPVELAKIGQYAENVYFGKPSGLMDQIGCAQGGIVGIDFKDNRNPVLTPIDVNFEDYGYSLVIVDTKGDHANLTPEYAAVPAEMKAVAAYFGKTVLREVDFNDFIAKLPEVRKALSNDRAVLRAYHYFTENERVDSMLEALKNNDIASYLDGVQKSGASSFRFLQNVYASSMPAEQGLSVGIAVSEQILKDKGVVRVHGGGFAGTIQAYVPDGLLYEYIDRMDALFGEGAATVLAIRPLPTTRLC